MEAKEKAQELVDKYRTTIRKADVYGNLASEDEIYLAKECALIAVDEILNVASPDEFTCKFFSGDYYSDQDYFIVVKTEIKQL